MSRDRDNGVYKEIESFEKYELTNCISFEMAIRNDEIAKCIIEYLSIIDGYPNVEMSPFRELLKQKLKEEYFLNENLLNYILQQYKMNNIKSFKKKADQEKEYFSKNIPFLKNKDTKATNEIIEECMTLDFEDLGGIGIRGILSNEFNLSNVFKGDLDPNDMSSFFRDLLIATGGINKTKYNVIFKRPLLELPNDYKIELPIINYSLPLDELVSYITQIKKELYKTRTPLEVLGKELNLSKEIFKNMTSKEWADNFYMYDYFKKSKEQSKTKHQKIQEDLTEYHGYKIEKTNKEQKRGEAKTKIVSFKAYNSNKEIYKNKKKEHYYGISTIKGRLKLMKALIDDCKYKTLLT